MSQNPIPQFISAKALAALLGVKIATLSKWRRLEKGPEGWIHLSGTLVVYPISEVEKFLAAKAEHPKVPSNIFFGRKEQEDRP